MSWSDKPREEKEDAIILPVLDVTFFVAVIVLVWHIPSSWWVF